MTIWRRAAKRDQVEPEIVDALEKAGVKVWRLSKPFDLLCGHRGKFTILECKSRPKLRKDQQAQTDEINACKANGLPVHVVRTADEALKAVGAVR